MKQLPIMLGVTCLSLLFSSCTLPTGTEPTFPQDSSPQITSLAQFDQILSDVEGQKGKMMKLAGQVERVESTDEGYKALVNWLPYPPARRVYKGPQVVKLDEGRRYLIFFRGKVNTTQRPLFIQGNRFVVEGKVKGTENTVIDMFGTQKDLLSINANCVRIWETGMATDSSDPDSQYPLPVARTICAAK